MKVRVAVFVAGLILLGRSLEAAKTPVVFVGPDEIVRLKRNVASGQEPFVTAWGKVRANAEAAFGDKIEVYQGKDTVELRVKGHEQAGFIRDLILVCHVTGEQKYADRAKEFFVAWAAADPMPGKSCLSAEGKNQGEIDGSGLEGLGLNLGGAATDWANAYALVYEHLTSSERSRAKRWLRFLADECLRGHDPWIESGYYGAQDYNNHITGHIMGMAAVGFALNDQEWIDYALQSDENPRDFYEMHDHAILMPTKPDSEQLWAGDPTRGRGAVASQAGEIYDRYRTVTVRDGKGCGLPYAMFHKKMLTHIAEMAWQNGIDLYSHVGPNGENLESAYEFYADFMITADPSIKGGYYKNNKLHLNSLHMYELANLRYPGTPKIMEALARQDRVQFDHEVFGWTACLLYGEPTPAWYSTLSPEKAKAIVAEKKAAEPVAESEPDGFDFLKTAQKRVVFGDQFDSAEMTTELNAHQGQGGAVAPLRYAEDAKSASGGQHDEYSRIGVNRLEFWNRIHLRNVWAAPEHNFMEAPIFKVEVDVNPILKDTGAPCSISHYAGLMVGLPSPDASQGPYSKTAGGISFIVKDYANGHFLILVDGETVKQHTALPRKSGAFHLEIVVVAGELKAGVPARLGFFLDGELVHSMTYEKGIASNYISLLHFNGSRSAGDLINSSFDNLKVTVFKK